MPNLASHLPSAAADGAAGNAGSPGIVGMSDDREAALDSVVKVFAVASSPNYWLPWQSKPQREVTGSGFVVSGRRILTSAHVVADHTFVLVRRHGSPKKFLATVEAVAHDCDLALLSVKDPASVGSGEGGINGGGSGDARADSEEFWEGMRALELGDVPLLQESIAVVGYPQGMRALEPGDVPLLQESIAVVGYPQELLPRNPVKYGSIGLARCRLQLGGMPLLQDSIAVVGYPQELGDVPLLQESIAVVGCPQGGDNISITMGVVSRVEPTQYVHSAAHLLAIQSTTTLTSLSPSQHNAFHHLPMSGGDNISITMGVVSRVEPTQYVHSAAHLLAIQIDAAINPSLTHTAALLPNHPQPLNSPTSPGGDNISISMGVVSRVEPTQYVHSAAHLLAIQIDDALSHLPLLNTFHHLPMSGGDNISITMGVVSRVEPTQYVHSAAHLLAIQIDAAINPGNSGGPALIMPPASPAAPAAPPAAPAAAPPAAPAAPAAAPAGGVEVPIIRRFLADAALGHRRFPGFASLGVSCQPLENWQLRAHLKMPRGATGVVVNAVQPLSDSSRWLKNDDVLTAFDGVPIANDGSSE
ncbi:unnamed protein product [Closterium sp. Yama58-4]|nr:unnamed protein product [Closterium sp. Yama58-4]